MPQAVRTMASPGTIATTGPITSASRDASARRPRLASVQGTVSTLPSRRATSMITRAKQNGQIVNCSDRYENPVFLLGPDCLMKSPGQNMLQPDEIRR